MNNYKEGKNLEKIIMAQSSVEVAATKSVHGFCAQWL